MRTNCYFDTESSECIPDLMSHLLVKALSLAIAYSTQCISIHTCHYQASSDTLDPHTKTLR